MTDQEIADRLATAAGWVQANPTDRFAPQRWAKNGMSTFGHPFPVGDVNATLAAWPSGWKWKRESEGDSEWWAAFRVDWDGEEYPFTEDTHNVWHDLALLTAMVLEREAGR